MILWDFFYEALVRGKIKNSEILFALELANTYTKEVNYKIYII